MVLPYEITIYDWQIWIINTTDVQNQFALDKNIPDESVLCINVAERNLFGGSVLYVNMKVFLFS